MQPARDGERQRLDVVFKISVDSDGVAARCAGVRSAACAGDALGTRCNASGRVLHFVALPCLRCEAMCRRAPPYSENLTTAKVCKEVFLGSSYVFLLQGVPVLYGTKP
eukprot:828294-Pleurochrysis_carterae.AAC.3